MKPRPCGCKGCRTCLICETYYGANVLKATRTLSKDKGYVYCPLCDKAWSGWDIDLYKQHPNHEGTSIDYPGVYIKLDFISSEEEKELVKNIDEVPWDISQSGRRKQNYGPKTNFKKQKIVAGKFEGFPLFSKFLQDRFRSIDLLEGYEVIEQCSLEYDPSKGASIDPHIDDCWVWGERIVTVNCLSDSVLTMTPYKGDMKKYNLFCADKYPPLIESDGKINLECEYKGKSMLEFCKPVKDWDVIIRIPLIRYLGCMIPETESARPFQFKFKTLYYAAAADLILNIDTQRRSLTVIYGESRYHWEHCVLREDITSRRVCIAYREFTPPYMSNGIHSNIGQEIRDKGKQFWDHCQRYKDECKIENLSIQ